MRYRYVMVETQESERWPPLLREQARAKKVGSLITRVSIEGCSRMEALARIVATGAKSVLLCGAESLATFRPDLKLSKIRGVPMVINYTTGKSPVVAVPTIHPSIAGRVKNLATQFEDDFAQMVYRGVKDPLSRWPDQCVVCEREMDHYDAMGLAWCGSCYRGSEPPKHVGQMALEV